MDVLNIKKILNSRRRGNACVKATKYRPYMRVNVITSFFSQTATCHNAQIPKHALNLQKNKGLSVYINKLNVRINFMYKVITFE